MIEVKLNVNDIPKEAIFEGTKGRYLDICVSEMKEADKYGNTYTVYIRPKEKGAAKVYIGKGKTRVWDDAPQAQPQNQAPAYNPNPENVDDLPF